MADIEYDLDTSGGLMEQIQALLAPPTNNDTTQLQTKNGGKEISKHPYYKRPGKGHNHDSCDACTEGGDLICCDKCPASFHLQCHDPPLEESDIPQGQWLCHTCRKNAEIKAKDEMDLNTRKRLRNNNNSKLVSTSTIESQTVDSTVNNGVLLPMNKKLKPNPLEVLVQAASVLNPKQFELPKALHIPCPFPGTDKNEILNVKNGKRQPARGGNGTGTGNNGKQIRKAHELQPGGIVPLPARTCFECGRSCRVAPLLACDYCPLFFHQDCLDPPLTAPPPGRWMCPNHVEQYIDSKLVTSVSATERIKLWDRFTGPIDQDAIKTEFIRKAHCRNPPFRIKVNLGTRSRVKVPGIVRYHYKYPVDLLPSLRDIRRVQTVLQRTTNAYPFFYQNDDEDIRTRQRTSSNNGSSDDVIMINSSTKILAALGHNDISQDVDRELKQLDDRLVRFLAYQRLQQLTKSDLDSANINTNTNQSTVGGVSSGQLNKTHKHMPLPSELLTAADIERISRVFLSPTKQTTTPPAIDLDASIDESSSSANDTITIDRRIRARAILYPIVLQSNSIDNHQMIDETIDHKLLSQAIAMRYRSLTIGRGPNNHLDCDQYGHCQFVSPKHAVIFYDESAQKYELINYSEHGTSVNNVLYTCDFSMKRTNKLVSSNTTSTTSASLIADIVEKRKTSTKMAAPEQTSTKFNNNTTTTTTLLSSSTTTCLCGQQNVPSELTEGWEGTAILAHGTLLKFGCISFVFSITDESGV